jgi:hypothetical protein
MRELQNILSALASVCAMLLALACLQILGQETYALPALSITEIRQWLNDSDPIVVVLSLVRAAAVVAVLYVLATTVLCAIAYRSPWRHIAVIADRISLPASRTLAVRLAGITAIGTLAMPSTSAFATPTASDTPVLRHLAPGEPMPTFQPITTSTTVKPTEPAPATSVVESPIVTRDAPAPMSTSPSNPSRTVQRGENFWTIARSQLLTSLEREPTENEVVTYWRELVKRNQQVLLQPENPDLLFAGQVIELP